MVWQRQLSKLLPELSCIIAVLIDKRRDILALRMYGASKPDSLVSSVEDCVVAMEKVESKYPVPNFWTIH